MVSYRPDANHYRISTMTSLFFRPVLGGHGQLGKMLSLNTNVCSVYRARTRIQILSIQKSNLTLSYFGLSETSCPLFRQ
jgi:hypothetical protein